MIFTACAASDLGKRRSRNEDAFALDVERGLFIVADGMGGHAAGDVASQLAVETVRENLSRHSMGDAVLAANRAVFDQSRANPAQGGMGTTLTVLLRDASGANFICGHVGDSRVYRLRDGRFDQLTVDHGIPGTSMLTRAIGTHREVEVDVFDTPIVHGDRYLICSDGLTGMVHDEDLRAMLLQDKPLDAICREMIDAANRSGGIDNITVIVVNVGI